MNTIKRSLAKLGLLLGILALSTPALAVINITVEPEGTDAAFGNFTNCSGGGANCSVDNSTLTCPRLRDAISCTEQTLGAGAAAPSIVINLPAEEIIIDQGEIDVFARSVEIIGQGRDVTTINGNNANRIFDLEGNGVDPASTDFILRDVNVINGNGGGAEGGAIRSNGKEVKIYYSRFAGNSGGWRGGAISIFGGSSMQAVIEDSLFEGNSNSGAGGAISFNSDAGTLEIHRSAFFNNNTASEAGAILIVNGRLKMHNSTVEGNTSQAPAPNGEIGFAESNIETSLFQNVTLTDNLLVMSGNSIVTHDVIFGGTCDIQGSIVDEGGLDSVGNLAISGSGCVDEAPLAAGNFIVPDFASLGLGTFDSTLGYWPLEAGSPAIDQGDPTPEIAEDQLNNTPYRPLDGDGDGTAREDIGAVEFDPSGITGICGNLVCESGEDANSCVADCSGANICGNLVCEAGENTDNCNVDCDTSFTCGNGLCEAGESIDTCQEDCAVEEGGCSLSTSTPKSASPGYLMIIFLGLSGLGVFAWRFRNRFNSKS